MPFSDEGSGLDDSPKAGRLAGALSVFVIAFAAYAAYASAMASRFQYDDIKLVVLNTRIRDFSNLWVLLASGRPVRALTFLADYAIWGLNPRGFHLTNIILHIAASSFLYFYLKNLFKDRYRALAAAVIFAVHPVGSEAVVNVSHRKEMLAMIFMLASLLSYRKFGEERDGSSTKRILYIVLAFVSFLLAIGSKQVAIVVPAIIFAGDFFFSEGRASISFNKRWLIYLAPIGIPIILFIVGVGDWNVFGFFPAHGLFSESYFGIVKVSGWAIPRYIALMFFPLNLQVDRFIPTPSMFDAVFGFALFIAISASAIIFRTHKRFAFALAWIAINLLPVLNLIPANESFSERYLYIPMAGVCVLIADGCFLVRGRIVTGGFKILVFAAVSALAGLWWVVKYWKFGSVAPMLASVVVVGTAMNVAATFLCDRLFGNSTFRSWASRSVLSLGIIAFMVYGVPRIVKVVYGPDVMWTHEQYVTMLKQFQAMYPESAKSFDPETVRKKRKFNFSVFVGILGLAAAGAVASGMKTGTGSRSGVVFGSILVIGMMAGLTSHRVEEWRNDKRMWGSNIRRNPTSYTAMVNYGVMARRFGRYDEALWAYRRAVRIQPNVAETRFNLAIAYIKLEMLAEAEIELRETIKLDPLHADARLNLGNILQMKNELIPAINEYRSAIQVRPNNARAYYNMAVALERLGRTDEAMQACRSALAINPEYTEADAMCGRGFKPVP